MFKQFYFLSFQTYIVICRKCVWFVLITETDEPSLCYRISSSLRLLFFDLNNKLFSPSNKVKYIQTPIFFQPSGQLYSDFIQCFYLHLLPCWYCERANRASANETVACLMLVLDIMKRLKRQENQLIGYRKTACLDLVYCRLNYDESTKHLH